MGVRFSRVPAHYPDSGNPGYYMNVFTPCTLNHVQQQPVDDFVPRANLKRFFKDDAISTGDSEAKEAASRYFCCTCLSISDMLRNCKLYLR